MKTASLRASLRLWRWRYHRYTRLLAKAHGSKERARLRGLLKTAHARILRREHQLAARKPHVHRDWFPDAHHHPANKPGTTWQVNCPSKGVLHTTEGPGDATGTLDAKAAWPHFQVERDGRVTQYYPMSVGARALVHNGPPTNGAHAFQIEVCGYASRPAWPAAQMTALRKLMRFIEANGGVARECHVEFVNGGGARLNASKWLSLRGWCGHQHVPGNTHVDPGKCRIKELLA